MGSGKLTAAEELARLDERGRFSTAGGFDGGARQPVPSPPPTHDQWLVEVLREVIVTHISTTIAAVGTQ